MSDENKLRAMDENGYEIVDSCMTCSFGPARVYYGCAWSQCMGYAYEHSQSGARLPLPSHAALQCRHHRRAPWVDRDLGVYADEPWKRRRK